jgi:hypothetical protein
MNINSQGSGSTSNSQAILPRSRTGQQAGSRSQAAQQLNNTWGKPPSFDLSALLNLIQQLIQALRGSGKTPDPKPQPQPEPTPQPVYGTIQPPIAQPVYGAIQPPLIQPVYGAITPPENEKPPIQPVYGAILSPKDQA